MKRIRLLIAVIVVVMMSVASTADAGCVLAGDNPLGPGQAWGDNRPITIVYHCVADGANTINEFKVEGITGQLQHTEVVPVSGKEPTSVTTKIKTSKILHAGSEIGGSPAYTATSAIASPWPRENLETPYGFSNGMIVYDTVVCDATDEWYRLFTFL